MSPYLLWKACALGSIVVNFGKAADGLIALRFGRLRFRLQLLSGLLWANSATSNGFEQVTDGIRRICVRQSHR